MVILVPTVEDLGSEILRIQQDLQGTDQCEWSNLYGDSEIRKGSFTGLYHQCFGIPFSTDQPSGEAFPDSPFSGMIYLAFDVESMHQTVGGNVAPSLVEPEETSDLEYSMLPTASVIFDEERTVSLARHEGGWDPSTARSQYGTMIGSIDAGGLGSYESVYFFSAEHWNNLPNPHPGVRVSHRRNEFAYGGSRPRIPDSLPLPFSLIDACSHQEGIRYRGFGFRPCDIEWGNGEFTMLTRHLGLGNDDATKYEFPELRHPHANLDMPLG